jgi:hypothetical protein
MQVLIGRASGDLSLVEFINPAASNGEADEISEVFPRMRFRTTGREVCVSPSKTNMATTDEDGNARLFIDLPGEHAKFKNNGYHENIRSNLVEPSIVQQLPQKTRTKLFLSDTDPLMVRNGSVQPILLY